MDIWRPDRAQLKRPVYLSLAEQIAAAVDGGAIEPGQRLPPQRELADSLGVSLQTVSRAYEELARRGLTQGEVGRGTYVQARRSSERTPFASASVGQRLADLSILKPVLSQVHTDCMQAALASLGAAASADLLHAFRPIEGLDRHRLAAVDWLRLCGLDVRSSQIIVTNGVSQAAMAAFMAAGKPGGCVAAEAVGHHALAGLCAALGMRALGLETDAHGLVPAALERACRDNDVCFLFLVPNPANPLARMMPEERRRALVDVARAHGIRIVENDVLGPLPGQTPPPLTALAPERSFYMTSFTKCLLPGLRTGYLTAPQELFPLLRSCQLLSAWMATPLVAEIASRWVQDGTAMELVRLQRRELQSRSRLAGRLLSRLEVYSHPGALHIWLPLTNGWTSEAFVARAQELGIAVAPAGPFVLHQELARQHLHAVRISLGSVDEDVLERSLRILAQLAAQRPGPGMEAY